MSQSKDDPKSVFISGISLLILSSFFFVIILTCSCSDKDKDKIEKAENKITGLPAKTDLVEYKEKADILETRLMDRFLENGYLVDRDRDNQPLGIGDSALFTGLAMGVLPCDKSKILFDTVYASIIKNNGQIIRHEPLPDSHLNNSTSRDMHTGVMFGFNGYYDKCKDDRVKDAWARHIAYVDTNGTLGVIGENCDRRCTFTSPFRHTWESTGYNLGLRDKPDKPSKIKFEVGAIAGTEAITNQKMGCYPIHLTTIQLIILAKMGDGIGSLFRLSFCSSAKSADLPLTDWYCEQDDWLSWLDGYQVDSALQYQHQRCPRWEDLTLNEGETNSGLDWLILYHLANGG